jgi:hypothetical protein
MLSASVALSRQLPVIDTTLVRDFVTDLSSATLARPAANLLKNLEDISGLNALPSRILIHGNFLGVWSLTQSVANFVSKREQPFSAEDYSKLFEDYWKDEEHRAELLRESRHEFDKLLSVFADIRDSLKSLRLASASALWTAFECLCSDVWVKCVNAYPNCLVPSIVATTTGRERDEMSGRQIDVGLLAHHGFDRRDCMGDIQDEV